MHTHTQTLSARSTKKVFISYLYFCSSLSFLPSGQKSRSVFFFHLFYLDWHSKDDTWLCLPGGWATQLTTATRKWNSLPKIPSPPVSSVFPKQRYPLLCLRFKSSQGKEAFPPPLAGDTELMSFVKWDWKKTIKTLTNVGCTSIQYKWERAPLTLRCLAGVLCRERYRAGSNQVNSRNLIPV